MKNQTPDFFHYFPNRRLDQVGVCNICQKVAKLGWDHVPPAGCTPRLPVEVRSMFRFMTGGLEARGTTIQDGLKFRTICEDCNTKLLGNKYDRPLSDFVGHIARCISSPIFVPKKIRIRCRPSAIIKSVLGHLLAARVDDCGSSFDAEVRACVLDEKELIPDSCQVHYWIHPHPETVVMRDTVLVDFSATGVKNIFFNMIKFFPIAFFITNREDILAPPRFGPYKRVQTSEYHDVVIDLRIVKAANWPENPEKTRATFFGSTGASSAYAIPKA